MEVGTWYGVFAPKGTSPQAVERLNREINAVLAMPEVQHSIRGMWEVPAGGGSQAFLEETRRDFEVYEKIVREFRITAD